MICRRSVGGRFGQHRFEKFPLFVSQTGSVFGVFHRLSRSCRLKLAATSRRQCQHLISSFPTFSMYTPSKPNKIRVFWNFKTVSEFVFACLTVDHPLTGQKQLNHLIDFKNPANNGPQLIINHPQWPSYCISSTALFLRAHSIHGLIVEQYRVVRFKLQVEKPLFTLFSSAPPPGPQKPFRPKYLRWGHGDPAAFGRFPWRAASPRASSGSTADLPVGI